MKLSVLIPVYNAEKYLKETLESILSQTFTAFELLICDDGSSDNSVKIIQDFIVKDQRIRFLQNEKNIGKPLTIKRLFEHSQGEIITMHDADDISFPDRFEKMLEYMDAHPQYAMCGHIIQRLTEDGKPLNLFRNKSADFEEIKKQMQLDNTDGDPSMFIRREIVDSVGGLFRPYFQNNMDYDLALRIIEKYQTSNLLEVLSYYRNVGTSISKGITSYKKLITQKVTQWLAEERKQKGIDSLTAGDYEKIRQMEELFSEPYKKDKTLYLHELTSKFMYFQMYDIAIKSAFAAVKKEPFKFKNWRLLQYCLRNVLLK